MKRYTSCKINLKLNYSQLLIYLQDNLTYCRATTLRTSSTFLYPGLNRSSVPHNLSLLSECAITSKSTIRVFPDAYPVRCNYCGLHRRETPEAAGDESYDHFYGQIRCGGIIEQRIIRKWQSCYVREGSLGGDDQHRVQTKKYFVCHLFYSLSLLFILLSFIYLVLWL